MDVSITRALKTTLASALLVLAATSGASAQSEAELDRARTLFGEGVELTQQEQWADAADRFRQVMEVRATGQVKYNLALALSHTTELAEAAVLLREAVDDHELRRRTRREATNLLESIRAAARTSHRHDER